MDISVHDFIKAFRRGHWWDRIAFEATEDRLFSAAARITFDHTIPALVYSNATTLADYTVYIAKIPHDYVEGSDLTCHVSWYQNQNQTPNLVVDYKLFPFGGALPGAWTRGTLTNNRFTYAAGNIHQITDGTTITGTTLQICDIVLLRLYRDTGNASGLFGGADPYVGNWELAALALHYEKNAPGSWAEYLKWG